MTIGIKKHHQSMALIRRFTHMRGEQVQIGEVLARMFHPHARGVGDMVRARDKFSKA